LIILCVQLAELIGRTVLTDRAGARRESARSGCKALVAVAATALLYGLSPARAVGSEISARLEGSEKPEVSLTQSPLVMRVGKDEFRVAFGINSVGCAGRGCYGAIRYRVNWKAEDGTIRSDIREVGYTVVPTAARTITVDRQYFDTSEGAHTTDV